MAERRQSALDRRLRNGAIDAVVHGSVHPVVTVPTNGAAAA
jgi:hypothetical protein